MNDRTVHASNDWAELVRYDRTGKWYVEPRSPHPGADRPKRRKVGIEEAVELASCGWASEVHIGLPGGGRFDYLVRKARDA